MNPSKQPTILITGAAGFIGFHVLRHYHYAGYRVIGVDNPAYFAAWDIRRARLNVLLHDGIVMELGDLATSGFAHDIMARHQPQLIVHLAAHVSTRCHNAAKFGNDNIVAFMAMLAAARDKPPLHFLFASSSSVYGENTPRPFAESAILTTPTNWYANSKYTGEIIARFWSQSGRFPITGIRFFNVYGPWGRPDMAPFRFADCLANGNEVTIISGDTRRSWLYIDDAVAAVAALAANPPPAEQMMRIVNVAGPRLIHTMEVLQMIAKQMKKTPQLAHKPPRTPEVTSNPACIDLLKSIIGFTPQTDFIQGLNKFLPWHEREWSQIATHIGEKHAARKEQHICRNAEHPHHFAK